ncbi:MAG: type I restriction enzyme HsdR N-terminal domain-containing protein, partial [Clostridiales bacterium]|nr:type I restriction enzyme HsdR N-terminal domain-containing protein [Clostridiales bacterium]
MSIRTETETVIKRLLPYLERRGYSIVNDLDFETAVKSTDSYSNGYIDVLVTLGKTSASFLIEAKRISKKLTAKDRDQAINYAKAIKVPFVVVTNGVDIHCYNTKNKKRILWDGKTSDKIPSKEQLKQVMRILKVDPDESVISISNDNSLPYRPGLPLRQLNALFYKGHSTIRKIEKNEEYAFSDFSKLLFLKLL